MDLLLLRSRSRGSFSFFSTRAAERVKHGVVALMARIFEILIPGFLSERERYLERPRERLGIVDGHFVPHLVRTDGCVALSQFERVTGGSAAAIAADSRPVSQEIRGLH